MSSVPDAIEAIKQISSNLVVLPRNEQYNEILNSYFSELERELKLACFLVPSSASEVSQIMKTLRAFAEGIKFAVCGSGQQATPGVANVKDGITIHLQNLRGVELNTGKKTVSVAAGERWGKVYETVMAAGLGVVGNRHSSGGIGGDVVQGELFLLSMASRKLSPVLTPNFLLRWALILLVLVYSWLRLRQCSRLRGCSCQRRDRPRQRGEQRGPVGCAERRR